MMDREEFKLSVSRQCRLLAVNRDRLEVKSRPDRQDDQKIKRLVDEIHLEAPYAGTRMIRKLLRSDHGRKLSRRRLARLMREMKIDANLPEAGHEPSWER
jgi:putative transposase